MEEKKNPERRPLGDSFYAGNGTFGKMSMPLSLGMALAQNADAMKHFSSLPDEGRKEFIEGSRRFRTNEELREYVRSIEG